MSKITLKIGDTLKIYTDGAARGNPGPAAIAFLFVHNNRIIFKEVDYIGRTTNNSAEYQAIINALKKAEQFSKGLIQVFSDSNLAIQQINKKWKINKPHLSKLCKEVYLLSKKYEKVEFFQVARNNLYIQKCDSLCNKRLDKEGIKN
ncbi:MAG: ribonuclease HI family protein [Candidatus Hodarchaeota archaeon]